MVKYEADIIHRRFYTNGILRVCRDKNILWIIAIYLQKVIDSLANRFLISFHRYNKTMEFFIIFDCGAV